MNAAPLDLDDIQGNILRGYRLPDVRYLMLQVADAGGGRAVLGALLAGSDAIPAVETASDWETDDKPTACLNVFVSAPGLTALGVPDAVTAAFPAAFTAGSAARSAQSASDEKQPWGLVGIGDIGDGAPTEWVVGGPNNPAVHLVVSIFSNEEKTPCRDAITAALTAVATTNQTSVVGTFDGNTFPDGVVHFGYRDGLSQPQIAGRPGGRVADMQPDAPTGDFLIGADHVNTYGGNYIGDIPPALGDNGSYMALRILRQDCAAFEDFIARTAVRFDMDPALVAAKMVGRWRDGTPVAVSPDDDGVAIEPDRLNEFDHAATLENPTNFDDSEGVRCPFGSHMRRMNPRGGPVTGLQYNRRIVRRGVPYGPVYDPAHPDDGIERGLLGAFICGDIEASFEFLMKIWANMDIHEPGIRGSRDPIIGWQPDFGGRFDIPTGDSRGTVTAIDLPRLVTTRGSLYLFIPGIGGLKALAAGKW